MAHKICLFCLSDNRIRIEVTVHWYSTFYGFKILDLTCFSSTTASSWCFYNTHHITVIYQLLLSHWTTLYGYHFHISHIPTIYLNESYITFKGLSLYSIVLNCTGGIATSQACIAAVLLTSVEMDGSPMEWCSYWAA